MTPVGDTLYFVARSSSSTGDIWKSDGTADGTVQVTDVTALGTRGPATSQPSATPSSS